MRQLFILLMLFALCSCKQKNILTTSELNTANDNSALSNSVTNDAELEAELLDYERDQDSLRAIILKGKENKILKESFLQEMYIRNVVTVSKDSLYFFIPFNVHAADCGAPDCYSTDISFSFKLGDKLIFPKNIAFKERTHGCMDKEENSSGKFQLVEETPKHVIYHSAKQKSTLVLFNSNKENFTTAFYFTGVKKNRINGQNVNNIVKEYNENDENSIYPFKSWLLTTNDYENFMR